MPAQGNIIQPDFCNASLDNRGQEPVMPTVTAALQAEIVALQTEAPRLFRKLSVVAVRPDARDDDYLTRKKITRYLFKSASADIRRGGPGGGVYYRGEHVIFVGVPPASDTPWNSPLRVFRHEIGHYLDDILPVTPQAPQTASNGHAAEMVADTFALFLHLRTAPHDNTMLRQNIDARTQCLLRGNGRAHYTCPAVTDAADWAKDKNLAEYSLESLLYQSRDCALRGMDALNHDTLYQKAITTDPGLRHG